MKAVILLAGVGRRMKGKYENIHKSLIPLDCRSILEYLIKNIKLSGINEIIPVVGYQASEILYCLENCADGLKIEPVYNRKYESTNNLVSLVCAENTINGSDFVLCNGDMVFDYRILNKITEDSGSRVAIDRVHRRDMIDSPAVQINEKIIDLGRHIPRDASDGYAIGVYKFTADIVEDFFKASRILVKEDEKHGFHDPLRILFRDHDIYPTYIENMLWMDVDEESDLDKAQQYIRRMAGDYK